MPSDSNCALSCTWFAFTFLLGLCSHSFCGPHLRAAWRPRKVLATCGHWLFAVSLSSCCLKSVPSCTFAGSLLAKFCCQARETGVPWAVLCQFCGAFFGAARWPLILALPNLFPIGRSKFWGRSLDPVSVPDLGDVLHFAAHRDEMPWNFCSHRAYRQDPLPHSGEL